MWLAKRNFSSHYPFKSHQWNENLGIGAPYIKRFSNQFIIVSRQIIIFVKKNIYNLNGVLLAEANYKL
jgi:hypothetical protein